MTQLELCNVALAHLGQARIAAIGDANASARACDLHYEPVLKEVLRSHRWNFAVKRHNASLVWMDLDGFSDDSGGIQVDQGSPHGLATGDRIHIRNNTSQKGLNGSWSVTVADSTAFILDEAVFTETGLTEDGEFVKVPKFGWSYQFDLPEDCLRVLEVNDSEAGDWISEEWVVEGRKLLTNASTLRLVYIRDLESDEALTDSLFAQAFALKLAVALSETIRGTTNKTSDLLTAYQNVTAPLARRVDANEGRRRKGLLPFNSLALRARRHGGPFRP
ncbi:hypothetical protein SAMN02745166_01505 [Prosthecobacter debontii]|uniref:Uncharacterized protein n=1 Tax=Prosthecobacter debontii TaxID=48467 RepID=A0A1T4XH43_9BACT|nr:hypothetical protein [Prosthecobacter debontii]SKA88902.1 hypothetical protein SAMN02745166_01505 [Prosthecobacter debontii]